MAREFTLYQIMKRYRDGLIFTKTGIQLGKSTAKSHGFMIKWKELKNGRYVVSEQEKV